MSRDAIDVLCRHASTVQASQIDPAARKAASVFLSAPDAPTVIVCGNDILALGVLFECLERGIRVPEEISITGYDGIDLSAHVTPALTTVYIPSAEMGVVAADHLAARLEGKTVADKTCLTTDLVIRATTAPPAARK